jgi:hypothetical protein
MILARPGASRKARLHHAAAGAGDDAAARRLPATAIPASAGWSHPVGDRRSDPILDLDLDPSLDPDLDPSLDPGLDPGLRLAL